MSRRRRKIRFRSSVNPACRDCQGTGWAPSFRDPKRFGRCHCWRVTRIGEAPMPAKKGSAAFDGKARGAGE